MSGAAVPYRLRPHKAVDRRLFMELLNRCERWLDLSQHAYVSMASYALEDTKLAHRLLGITRLLAFDYNAGIVARQEFNKPIDTCRCAHMSTNELVADLVSEVERVGITDANGFVVWLDYTSPKEAGTQIDEFQKLVAQFGPGDIVRVTVNASFDSWGGWAEQNGKDVPLAKRQAKAMERLKERVGNHLPKDVTAASLSEHGLARALARSYGVAAGRGVTPASGTVLAPLSIIRYADGQQMLSMTAMLVRQADLSAMRDKLGLAGWPFGSDSWDDVNFLAVPDLTARERLFLERLPASITRAEIEQNFGFDFDAVAESDGFIDNFRTYYRHYPALTPVEL